MMNLKIYTIGDKLEKFFIEAIKEYEKRLSRYFKIELLHLKNQEQFIKTFSDKSYKIVISVKGESISSKGLASKISTLGLSGISDIAIIIGTSIHYDESLSISPMDMDL